MTKAIFFDVDGTLISHSQKTVPATARTALEQLSEKGIKRVLATGRHMLELSMLPVKDIAFDGYITLNGQLCLDEQGNIVSGNPITGQSKAQILRLFHDRTIPIVLVEKDRLYINFVNAHVEFAQEAVSTPIPAVGAYTGNEIYLAVAYLERERDLSDLLPGCAITRWNDYAVDIIAATGGKTAGIREYCRINNIKQEETMAFGDGENDMDMLKYVHIGVAMGNADPCVKEIADHVTGPVDGDGILEALTVLGVIP